MRRQLVSRKYSYKASKGYLYYNKECINHIRKNPFEMNDEEIKDYLVYLSEEKGAATSTLNQAINALKFYYGVVLKKKCIFEVKKSWFNLNEFQGLMMALENIYKHTNEEDLL
jgi:integrase/recombinase XerD